MKRRLLSVGVLALLTPIAVYASIRDDLVNVYSGLPTDVRRIQPDTQAPYGPAAWRFGEVMTTDRLRTQKWDATAPPSGTWVVARISYRLNSAPPEEYWCEVAFFDRDGRRFDIESGTTIDGRISDCAGEEEKRPAVGTDHHFTVAALVPDGSAASARPRVTVRKALPVVLELIRA